MRLSWRFVVVALLIWLVYCFGFFLGQISMTHGHATLFGDTCVRRSAL
jgi:hypothetical protein